MSDMRVKNVGVQIKPGAYIEDDVVIHDHVTIGENAVVLAHDFTSHQVNMTTIKSGAYIGQNATIYPGVTIGEDALVHPGAVVTRSVPPLAIVEGNPAIIKGYRSTHSNEAKSAKELSTPISDTLTSSKVSGVTFHDFKMISDLRGNLTVGEFGRGIPFAPKRYFLVLDVPTVETRGEHAHRVCQQFLVCVKGQCSVVADDGINREEFVLDKANKGLYLPKMVWGIQYKYSHDAMLLVFASHYYDSSDYIRDYDEFKSLAKK